MRAAASLPEMSTVGTPTPGVVPQPASTTLSVPRTRLRGRNGPVWAKVWATENGLPAAWPCAAQSTGVTSRSSSMAVREAVQAPALQLGEQAVAVARAQVAPRAGAGADVGVGAGRQDVVEVAARRREGGVGGGGPGDQQRRVAHQPPGAGEFVEGALPGGAEGERVVGRARGQVRSVPACRITADGEWRSGTGRRGRAAQQPVGDGQLAGEHDRVAGDALAAAGDDGA